MESPMMVTDLTVSSRLVVKVVTALEFRVRSVTIIGDSMCCVMAVKSEGMVFNAYFQHRLANIHENLAKLREVVDVVYPVLWVEGGLNPANMTTKSYARPE